MRNFQISIMDSDKNMKRIKGFYTEDEAWYWIKKIEELGGIAVVIYPL